MQPEAECQKTERFEMRMPTELMQRMNAWRRQHNDPPSRSKAIRLLLTMALDHEERRHEGA